MAIEEIKKQETDEPAETTETAANTETSANASTPKEEKVKKTSWFKRNWRTILRIGGGIAAGIGGFIVSKKIGDNMANAAFEKILADLKKTSIKDENGNDTEAFRQDFDDGCKCYWVGKDNNDQ